MPAAPGSGSADSLRQRLYRPGATDADVEAFVAVAGPTGEQQPETAPGTPAEAPPVPAPGPGPGRTRRRLLIGAGALVAAGGAVAAVRVLGAPPPLGPPERAAVSWRTVTGAPLLAAATVQAGQPSRSMADVPFERSRTDITTRAVFFGAGDGQLDFDMRRYFVGSSLVTVTLVTAATVHATVQLGVLAGVTHPVKRTAVTVQGGVPAGVPRWASSAVGPFDRPQVLRVQTDAGSAYLVRVEFSGPPLPDF